MLDRYLDAATGVLAEVAATQAEALEEAAGLVAASVAGGGVLHLFGTGHSQLLALDAYARAGGLACVHPILDPALSPATGLPGTRARWRATTSLAGTTPWWRTTEPGVMPRARMSSVKEVKVSGWRNLGSATNVPLPCTR